MAFDPVAEAAANAAVQAAQAQFALDVVGASEAKVVCLRQILELDVDLILALDPVATAADQATLRAELVATLATL